MRASAASKAASAASASPEPAKASSKRGRQLGQHFARAGAADRGAAAEMPAANRFGGGLRIVEAEAAQGRQRLGIVGDAGEDEIAGGGAEGRGVLEQARIMALDSRQMVGQVLGEGLEPRVAAELGEARELRALERQPLRLLVGDHLQAVLDAAQEEIGLAQVLDRLGADPAFGAEFGEHVERARAAHLRPAPAEDQLLRLDEELDLANAAAPELDVVAGHDDAVVAAHGVDLALHRVDVGDRGIVEIFAPDEGREVGEEALAELEIARGRPRLDQRRALPVLAERLVIGVGAGGRERDRRRGRDRAAAAGRPAAHSRRWCAPAGGARAPWRCARTAARAPTPSGIDAAAAS